MKRKKNPALLKYKSSCIINLALGVLLNTIQLPHGKNVVYSNRVIFSHLLNATVCQASINHVSETSTLAPSEGTVRHRLKEFSLGELEEQANAILQARVKDALPRRKLKIAVDYHRVPYHGEPLEEDHVVRKNARHGTTRFFCYATAYVVLNKHRYTLALKYCRRGESHVEVLDYLLAQLEELGIEVEVLLLDREYFNCQVINYLQSREIPFIMPCIMRGKSGGLRKLCKGRRSYSTTYTLKSPHGNATFQVNVVVRYARGRWGRHGIEYLLFAVSGVDVEPRRTHHVYRRRFGIESSYKLMGLARGRTSSRSPVLRLLYVLIAFLLVNLWIYAQRAYASFKVQSLKLKLRIRPLRFKTVLRALDRELGHILGFGEIPAIEARLHRRVQQKLGVMDLEKIPAF